MQIGLKKRVEKEINEETLLRRFRNLEKYFIVIYRYNPFKVKWTTKSSLLKELVGDMSSEEYVRTREIIDGDLDIYNEFDEVKRSILKHFKKNRKQEWSKMVCVRKADGKIGLFLFQAVLLDEDYIDDPGYVIMKVSEISDKEDDIIDFQISTSMYYKEKNKKLLNKLTKTEREIFPELAMGKSVTEIADKFIKSKHTIESHSVSIKRKLNCKNLYELMLLGYKLGINVKNS